MDKLQGMKDTETYIYLADKFGEKKIVSRYEWLYGLMEIYLEVKHLEDHIVISKNILDHVIVDYFVDVDRLKSFQGIEKTHDSKIFAYTAFWVLRHKPLQIKEVSNSQNLAFINEEFVSNLIRSFLFCDPDCPILNNKKEIVDNFTDTMLYHFKYRDYSAKNIELMILAFQAGRGYQYSVDRQ